MPDDEKHEVSVEVGVTPEGLKAKIRSRLVSAVDYFLGNKVTKRGVADELLIESERAKGKRAEKLRDTLADMAIDHIKNDPALVEDYLKSEFPGLFKARENIQGSITHASDHLNSLPPPVDEELEGISENLDEDWLNLWGSYAEKASSESMRMWWGRILAGEVRQPGAFSRRTLRIASELDKDTAEVFAGAIQRRLPPRFLVDPRVETKPGSLRIPQGDLPGFDLLDNAGLIEMTGSLGVTMTFQAPAGVLVKLEVGPFVLQMQQSPGLKISIRGFNLTHTGMELAALQPPDHRTTAELLARHVATACKWVRLLGPDGHNEVLHGDPEADG
ncbi:DUF2806 domain-containing protein [Mesorhizobium sp. AR02]|uniref:DUF2806 domain-containing protein n=1 Tax=Mesorhizobium sp. AR02 TaxID=2865837 RepID=UPI00216054BA|nr:DUF2806 domain-containing protein [Mesorhizobium sp. AR02]UVK51985.1 DUF2806 domain-containing protein [Mesorhizobium sp. AR02]